MKWKKYQRMLKSYLDRTDEILSCFFFSFSLRLLASSLSSNLKNSLKMHFSISFWFPLEQAPPQTQILRPLYNQSPERIKKIFHVSSFSRKSLLALLLQPSPSETSTTTMAKWSCPGLRVSCMKLHRSWSSHSSKVLPTPPGNQKIPFGAIDKRNNNKH